MYKIKILISVGEIETAAKIVSKHMSSPKLALILLTAAMNPKNKENIRSMILNWSESKIFDTFDPQTRELYRLAAGIIDHQNDVPNCKIDWHQELAIYLFYKCDTSLDSKSIIKNFLESYHRHTRQIVNEEGDFLLCKNSFKWTFFMFSQSFTKLRLVELEPRYLKSL